MSKNQPGDISGLVFFLFIELSLLQYDYQQLLQVNALFGGLYHLSPCIFLLTKSYF